MTYRVEIANEGVREFPTLPAALSYAVQRVYFGRLYFCDEFVSFRRGEVDSYNYGYGFTAVSITRLREAA